MPKQFVQAKATHLEHLAGLNYELIIAEKPKAALKIADALADSKPEKIVVNGVPIFVLERNSKKIVVASAVGHLFSLSAKYNTISLPIFDVEWRKSQTDYVSNYINVLKQLISKAKEITIACDYDIEGELIGYNVLRFLANTTKANRMKFSTLTKQELVKAYENKMQHIDFGQAIAGETRHILDWFYGINLSRALMRAIKLRGLFKILSIGRVQGPALKLVALKEKQIANFKPETYWKVFVVVQDSKGNTVKLELNKEIKEKDKLQQFKQLEGKQVKLDITTKKIVVEPPHPFDLTTLQTEAYKFFNITPARLLAIAQKLYLDGLISYPRTSSQKLPASIMYKQILQKLANAFNFVKYAVRQKPIEGKAADPAHPAIYPTGVTQGIDKLNKQERNVYELIVRRFVACFAENAEIQQKTIKLNINNFVFSKTAKQILQQGWLKVYNAKIDEEKLSINELAVIKSVCFEQKQTQPPKRYTPASLVKELAKRNLGTKGTRALIIETLYKRNYIEGNSIKLTPLGSAVENALDKFSTLITDEGLTRQFEKHLEAITTSKQPLEEQKKILEKAKQVLSHIFKQYEKVKQDIAVILADGEITRRKTENAICNCPTCNKGMLCIKKTKNGKRFIACSNYPECKVAYTIPQKGKINVTKKQCECGFPLLKLTLKRKSIEFCFNPNCKHHFLKKLKSRQT